MANSTSNSMQINGTAAYGTTAVSQLAGGISGASGTATSAANTVVIDIKGTLSSFDLSGVGANLMKGFVKGISSMGSAVISTAKSIASSAANTIKNALNINSPSKLTFGYGEYTGEGLALGIQKMKGKVTKAAEGLSTSVTASVEPAVNNYTPSSSSVSNTSNSNVTNTFSPQFTLNMNGASATESNKRKVKKWVKESIQETFESMARITPELSEV